MRPTATQLLRQWRRQQRRQTLQTLPLRLLLWLQCRSLAASVVDVHALTGLSPDRLRPLPQTASAIESENKTSVTRPARLPSLRRCLRPLRPWFTRLKRRLLVKMLSLLVLLFRLSRGITKR